MKKKTKKDTVIIIKLSDKTLKTKPKPLKKPPYNCPNTGDTRIGNGCGYPNCGCEWYL